MTTRCYEMRKGQKLVCKDCGFELVVEKECDKHCKEDGCCATEGFMCCGAPMALV
ncbi:hypothetical protein [uncultured Methanolobus sp.]|uniref:hypothetical protein n=1 Tax=uncultured Methanolobus sp. TaxID=218300 RepID=UPI002AAA66AD|nr:hypothetical protein [uncultured Methanolobus sp.]